MHPELVDFGPFHVSSYGFTISLAFIAGGLFAYRRFRSKGLNPDHVLWMVILAALGGILGAKLDYVIVNLGDYTGPESLFSGAGLIWYGGVAGAVLLTFPYMYFRKMPLGRVLDSAAPAIALGYGIARIGCFLMGTCYGKPSTLPWAVSFPNGMIPTPPGVTVQPTQLYEMLASFAIFGILLYLTPRLTRDWSMIGAYLVFAGIERFAVEFLRFSRDGQLQAQLTAAGIAVAGAFILVQVLRRSAGSRQPALQTD